MHIAIIGAGPAGAMAAVRLARAGASVSLFDPSHPREKPCGGGLTGRAVALVADLISLRALAPVVVHVAAVEPPDDSCGDLRTSIQPAHIALVNRGATPESSLVVLSRSDFDLALTNTAVAAGARFMRERATAVCERADGVVVRTSSGEHFADYVLGADGANSLVRRKLAAPFTRAQLSLAAGYFVADVTGSEIFLKSTRGRAGYLWSFPRRDHTAVGICAPLTLNVSSSALRRESRSWIDQHHMSGEQPLRPYAWPIPSIGFEEAAQVHLAGARWMLLGDAAGLVDPLTREGIYYALLSGQWAADALLSVAPSEAGTLYAERVRTDVHPELTRAARLSGLFFSAGFSSLFVHALRHSAAIRDVFADLVAGTQSYRGLRRRLLATGEWRLAARAIRLAGMPAIAGTMKRVALSH